MSEEVLGKDIRIDLSDDELMYGASNDFSIIQGNNNLHQAISLRLRTPYNTMLTHMNYGSNLPTLKGAAQEEETLSQAILYAFESLNAEPRIDEIIDIDANFVTINEEVFIQISCSVRPIESDDILNIVVVIN